MTLVYLDTETTGLTPGLHEVWEIAYAVDDGPILSATVTHSIVTADPTALAMNGYHCRARRGADPLFDMQIVKDLDGATLVGANPAFDAGFLRARWGVTPWRYRLLDVEAYAMGALGFDVPRGLKDVAAALRERGHEIPEPDHSAAGDVATLRACHKALETIYSELRTA